MTQSTHIKVSTAERITTIRFDRPDKKNAITVEMYAALGAALEAAAGDPQVRAAVLAGSRDCFTSGNDLGDFMRVAQGGSPAGTSDEPSAPFRFLRTIATFESHWSPRSRGSRSASVPRCSCTAI